MRDRTFADFMVGALACISVLGVYAVLKESELYRAEQRRRAALRWELPRPRRRRRSPEDDCRHCAGSGTCTECAPVACRVCSGTGLQPRDETLSRRLTSIWDGAA
ncbi:MAG TPA: hypothetical protein VMD91_05795 [Candidatus Sulfotelmatobacter sp.]|nr:hypothetical protein [Candidatus Sulfotelmatobacter sp.]